jgi:hypothetical protein
VQLAHFRIAGVEVTQQPFKTKTKKKRKKKEEMKVRKGRNGTCAVCCIGMPPRGCWFIMA